MIEAETENPQMQERKKININCTGYINKKAMTNEDLT